MTLGVLLTALLTRFAILATGSDAVAGRLLGIPWNEWASLNASVGGRLHLTEPLEVPCFSLFEGTQISPNVSECAVIQQNYTNPEFRSGYFGGFMNVRD